MPTWLYAAAMLTAVLGTRLGTWLLRCITDDRLRAVSGLIILAIAGSCFLKGAWGLFS